MTIRRIFVACGQETEEEKQLGKDVLEIIDTNGMKGFFAETVHSADELNTAVFEAVSDCGGFCAIMHKRGTIKYRDYNPIHRSSVWIQQEIAILMYRRFYQGRIIPVRVFCERGILLEGIIKTSIINPIEFEKKEEVLEGVSNWLTGPEFIKDPILSSRETLFQNRIQGLSEEHWLILQLIAVHSSHRGDNINKQEVAGDFLRILKQRGKSDAELKGLFDKLLKLPLQRGLIGQSAPEPRTGIYYLNIPPKWWDLMHEQIRSRQLL